MYIDWEKIGTYFLIICIIAAIFSNPHIIGKIMLLFILYGVYYKSWEREERQKYAWVPSVIVAVVMLSATLYVWLRTGINDYAKQAETMDCPADKPIKGNAQSGIYHLPDGEFYDVTSPERCFSSEEEAKKYWYRKSEK